MRIAATKSVLIRGLVMISVFAGLSCRKERTYIVEVKDGIRYVHNIKPVSDKPAASLAFVRKIGELEAKDPNFQFVRPISVAEDDRGNIYVLDDKDNCVKKFGADGAFVRRFGRKGQGPGEFEYPMTIGFGAPGRLVVSSMSSDFHVFNNDGEYVGHFRLPPYRGISPTILNSDRVVTYAFQVDGENSRDNHVLAVFDFKAQARHEFGEPHLLDTARKTWQANFMQIAVDAADDIFIAYANQNRIEKYSGTGRLLLSVDRALPYEIEYRYKKSTMDVGGKAVSIDQQVFTPVSRGIGVDGRGRIWVLTLIKAFPMDPPPKDLIIQDYAAFEVYSKEGVLLSRVPLPREFSRFDNMTMHGNHLFFVDPFDQACVFEYTIVD
jgi:hypothetical protein